MADTNPRKTSIQRSLSPDTEENGPGFEPPRCAECGAPLETKRAAYRSTRRIYCDACNPVGQLKEHWQPMIGGHVSSVFVLDSSGKIAPLKRS